MTAPIVVLSGGMDSTVALHLALSVHGTAEAVSVNYGQRHSVELEYAAQTCDRLLVDHTVIDAARLGLLIPSSALTGDQPVPHGHYADESMRATVVPNRNAILLNLAIGVAVARGSQFVYTGVHAGDHAIYPDCRPEFIAAMQALVDVALYPEDRVDIVAPFVRVGKHDIARLGSALGVDWTSTWSCYEGGDVHCGKCGTCVERIEAFELAGVADPTAYSL